MMILKCDNGYYSGRTIMCRKRKSPCAFVKMCELTGKFMQTDGAKTCKLNERGEKL